MRPTDYNLRIRFNQAPGISVPYQVLADVRLTAAQKLICAYVWHYQCLHGACLSPNSELQHLTNLRPNAVASALQRLEALAVIERHFACNTRKLRIAAAYVAFEPGELDLHSQHDDHVQWHGAWTEVYPEFAEYPPN